VWLSATEPFVIDIDDFLVDNSPPVAGSSLVRLQHDQQLYFEEPLQVELPHPEGLQLSQFQFPAQKEAV
jgi:hypothetical protein